MQLARGQQTRQATKAEDAHQTECSGHHGGRTEVNHLGDAALVTECEGCGGAKGAVDKEEMKFQCGVSVCGHNVRNVMAVDR